MDAPPTKRRRKGGYPLIIGTLVCVGAVLIVSSSFSSGTYSLEIASIVAEPDRFVGRDMKIVGTVKAASITTRTTKDRVETHFVLQDGKGHELAVVFPHNPPDPFKAERQVIVEGTLEVPGRVLCHKLTVKCPSKYQEEGVVDGRSDGYYQEKYGTSP